MLVLDIDSDDELPEGAYREFTPAMREELLELAAAAEEENVSNGRSESETGNPQPAAPPASSPTDTDLFALD